MRQIMLLRAIAAMTLPAALYPVLGQTLGDPSSGRQIATTTCGSCHYTFATKGSKKEFPPSFENIANLASTTALSLSVRPESC
jgi:cytochrome c2